MYYECKICGNIVDDGDVLNRICFDCLEEKCNNDFKNDNFEDRPDEQCT